MSEFTYRGCTVTFDADEFAESPRINCDHLGTMVCCHGRYDLGDRSIKPFEIEEVMSEFGPDMISLPLYLYDHSGLTMNTEGFSCPWDSGQVGRICVSLDAVRKEYGDVDPDTIAKVEQLLLNEVAEYDQYLRGDVYEFTIEYPDETEDSLCGVYGYEYCHTEARDMIDYAIDIEGKL